MRFALLLLAALVTLAVPGQAVTVDSVQVPAAPLKPEVETGKVTVRVTIACADLFPFGGVLDYAFMAPSSVVITGPASREVPACSTPQGSHEVDEAFEAGITRMAPGLEQLPAHLKVRFLGSQFSLDPLSDPQRTAEAPFTLAADAFFLTQAQATEKFVTCDCEAAVFQVELANFGNARTKYTFTLDEVPSHPDWQATTPEPLILESPNTGLASSNGTVSFHVRMPTAGQGAYRLLIQPSAADAPDKQGDPIAVNLLAVNTGPATSPRAADGSPVAELPSVGPALAFGLLAFAGLVRRRL